MEESRPQGFLPRIAVLMDETYLSDKEFETYYRTLSGLRSRVAADLPLTRGMRVLDLGSGEGFFTIEVGSRFPETAVVGIDVSKRAIRNATKNLKRAGLKDRVKILEMDATEMSFGDREFDIVVNFAGLEDIHMTRGRSGVEATFMEVNRVLKPDHSFCFVVMPPEEMETDAQRLEVELYSYICDATWLTIDEYMGFLERSRFQFVDRKTYHSRRRLTPKQARAEISFACRNVPKIYGKKTPSIEDVWEKFGREITENGLGQHSKVVLLIAKKNAGA